MKNMLKVSASLIMGGLILGAQILLAPAASAASYEGTDPTSTGCANDSQVVNTWTMRNARYNENQGTIELRYSPRCKTNWVNVYGWYAGNIYKGTIHQTFTNITYAVNAYGATAEHTKQTVAPAGICVNIEGKIFDIASGNQEGVTSGQAC